jgi:predicted ATPase
MKIKEIEVTGLNKSNYTMNIEFNDDINIITGRNGSGKTTLLKLMWYCISGNIERAVREIVFDKVIITTSVYVLQVEKIVTKKNDMVRFLLTDPELFIIIDKTEPLSRESDVEEANQETIQLLETSVFFPTFRRIEGGFSMTDSSSKRTGREYDDLYQRYNYNSEVQDALESHADMLSVGKHKFVSSISTVDIRQLVTSKHNNATTRVDNYSRALTNKIFTEIGGYKQTTSTESEALKDAVSTLDKIHQDVVEFEKVRKEAFNSLTVLSGIIVTIFKHKGIRLNPQVTLGDIKQSINSEALSAGEKQMLSFLCYNALYKDCPFFIDEPELSLHVDWQRILLDVLVEQNTNNQMFIATHSPFIYTQYEDKEIMIGDDRGYSNV